MHLPLAVEFWAGFRAFLSGVYAFILTLGGPGLFVIALADSSFLSIPEGNDILIVVLSTGQNWVVMSYYVVMTILGSVTGCALLYSVGRRGGSRIAKRVSKERLIEIRHLYSRWGVLTILIPSLLPPPTPFKIFVLSAGIFHIPFRRFFVAVLVGRSIRYFMWGILAVLYGEVARRFLENNIHKIGTVLAVLFFGAIVGYLLIWMRTRRRNARPEVGKRLSSTLLGVVIISWLLAGCGPVKKTTKIDIPPAYAEAKTASLEELVEILNQRYTIQSLTVPSFEVEFEAGSVEQGYLEEYHRAKGYLVAERPESIYVTILNPLTSSTVSAMAARQGSFQIWIPRENKFVVGDTDTPMRQDNPLYNVRPQHLLNGILIEAAPVAEGDFRLVLEEYRDRQNKYYVVSVIRLPETGWRAELIRKLWFERTRLTLTEQRYYESGEVVSIIRYEDTLEKDGKLVSSRLAIERPRESYTMTLDFSETGLQVNRAIKEGAFEIDQPAGSELVLVDRISLV